MRIRRVAAAAALITSLLAASVAPAFADENADDRGPVVSLLWPLTTVPNVIGKGSQSIAADATDPSGVDRYAWFVDGALRSQEQYLHYDFGAIQRTTTIEVWAWDVAGNHSVTTFPVTVDAQAPKATAFSPAPNTLLRGNLRTATVALKDRSVLHGALLLSGPNTTDTIAPFTGRFPLVTEGRQTLTWYVTDAWGNAGYVTQTVTSDNRTPTLKIASAPANGAKVKDSVVVKASATDRYGIAKVQLLVNGKVVATDSKAAYSFTLSTKKYGKKSFKIQLRAYDKVGNVTTTAARTWHR
ncbi:Ig-like domain-containing protein [Paractinoplanes hotanensis]|uniref:Ig-like domain-containing protein n=1 Tax=Paractinoplanes hotanensis TaxID=2906497 RepID=A0ABT0YG12_9ACTN|nr:Ig-like domain-containing protein [Actinoplanes hotanensis]MCM4084184.1 Ig-like domain-containing protein [Actinoplanes hotanensis]